MYRGTTPTIKVKLKNTDLKFETIEKIWFTLKSNIKEKTYEKEELTLNDEEKIISVKMSQEDTLSFSSGEIKIQIRFKDALGNSFVTKICKTTMNEILKGGVIK